MAHGKLAILLERNDACPVLCSLHHVCQARQPHRQLLLPGGVLGRSRSHSNGHCLAACPRNLAIPAADRCSWYHSCLSSRSFRRRGSAECERKSLHAGIEKLDLELAISNGLRLTDQLIQPLVGHRAVTLLVNVNAMSRARRLSIEEHAKAHGG